MLWNFTCPDTLAPSQLPITMFTADTAASSAESRKIIKYSDLSHSNIFIWLVIETMYVLGLGATDLVSSLGRRLAADSGVPRSAFF